MSYVYDDEQADEDSVLPPVVRKEDVLNQHSDGHQVGVLTALELEEKQEEEEGGRFLKSEQVLSYVYDDGQAEEDTESPTIKLEAEQEQDGLMKQSLPDDNEQVDVLSEKEETREEKELLLTSLLKPKEEEGRENFQEESPRNDKHAGAKHSSSPPRYDGKQVDASSPLPKLELEKEEEGREQFMKKDSGELNHPVFKPVGSERKGVAPYDGPVQRMVYYQSLRARRQGRGLDSQYRMERVVARWRKWFEDDKECEFVVFHGKGEGIWLALCPK